jgi:branched-chain amino acid transport system permease protein
VSDVRIAPPFLSDRGFYVFELVCLGIALLIVRNHHEGRLGRALLAIRDDEAGARASGIDVRRLRIVVFAVSAALAGLGGALLAQSGRAFDATTFDPVQSIIWFAAVVVFGIDSAAGAVLAAALLVGIDAAFYPGVSTIVVGAGAVLLGRLPGPFLYILRRIEARLSGTLSGVAPQSQVRLSPAGRRVAARMGR